MRSKLGGRNQNERANRVAEPQGSGGAFTIPMVPPMSELAEMIELMAVELS